MFNSFASIFHTIFYGGLSYIVIIALLRVSGKRTLSKWNSFDFVSTIAYGSMLATMVLSRRSSLLQGVLGIGVLMLLQFAITWLAVRSPWMRSLIKTQPRLLLQQGEMLDDALVQERVTEGEVRAAIRAQGIAAIEDVAAVVLETDGSFSVIRSMSSQADSALMDVEGYRGLAASANTYR